MSHPRLSSMRRLGRISRIRTHGPMRFVMGVSVSAHQLMSPGFVSIVETVIAESHTVAEHLCLEVTEDVFVQDAELALAALFPVETDRNSGCTR